MERVEERPIDIKRLTIADMTALVGYEPLEVCVENKWIAIHYPTMIVRIRKW